MRLVSAALAGYALGGISPADVLARRASDGGSTCGTGGAATPVR